MNTIKIRSAKDKQTEDIDYNDGFGYEEDDDGDLYPTDLQIDLQDEVDSTIQYAVHNIVRRYQEAASIGDIDIEHDIHKITNIRNVIEKEYKLPEVY